MAGVELAAAGGGELTGVGQTWPSGLDSAWFLDGERERAFNSSRGSGARNRDQKGGRGGEAARQTSNERFRARESEGERAKGLARIFTTQKGLVDDRTRGEAVEWRRHEAPRSSNYGAAAARV